MSIAVHALAMRALASFSVDVILLPIFLFVCLALWHINLCRLYYAKSNFIQINSFISNNSV